MPTQTVLMIGDRAAERAALQQALAESHALEMMTQGSEALAQVFAEPASFCALVVGSSLADMSGLEFVQRLHAQGFCEQLPVLLIAGAFTEAQWNDAYACGVTEVISQPFLPQVVRRRVQQCIELFQLRRAQQEVLAKSLQAPLMHLRDGVVAALAMAIEFRGGEAGGHVYRLRDMTFCFLSQTALGDGLSDTAKKEIALAAVLHDVGKIAVPDAILKKPGPLTPSEYAVMKTHTIQGERLLASIPQLRAHDSYRYARDIARHHHERWDGSGYPDGLKGDEISIWAQVVALVDVYDALRCKRCYKEAQSHAQALAMIRGGACGAFNPRLLVALSAVEAQLAAFY